MDLVATVDALGDMQYVISGTYLSVGVDDEPITDEIHASNLTKLGADGKPVYLPGNKVGKGPSFRRPDLRAVLARQGWQPGGEP
jgi:predicted HAD superfamily Cof-like phosphohydrolase